MKNGDYGNGNAVLIVDDDIGINKLFEFYLKTSGYTGKIYKAFNGQEAIDMCQEHTPAIVLMDIQMPLVDGISAIKKLRKIGFNNPILIVSAWAELERERCLEAGADEVISKPVIKADLIKYFHKYIDESENSANLSFVSV